MNQENIEKILVKYDQIRTGQRKANKTYYDKNKETIISKRKPKVKTEITEEQRFILREKARIYIKKRYETNLEFRELKKAQSRERYLEKTLKAIIL